MKKANKMKWEVNIELLRITAMLMVLMLHALGHGGILDSYEFGTLGYIVFWFLETICYVAVNIFILITGYFMTSLKMKFSRIIRLIIQVEFFSLFCLAVTYFVFNTGFTGKDLIFALFPLSSGEYWFASHYLVLITIIPLLNHLINSMDNRQLFAGTLLLVFVFSVIATIFPWSRNNVVTNGYSFVWFIVLYFVGSCLQKIKGYYLNSLQYFIIFIFLAVISLLSRLLIGCISIKLFGYVDGTDLLYSYNTLPALIMSICLLMTFKNMQIRINEKMANFVISMGKLSFGAYLCSDHNLIRKPLWKLCDMSKTTTILGTFIYALILVILIFLIGCILEWFRLKITQLFGLNVFIQKCDLWFDKFVVRVENVLKGIVL